VATDVFAVERIMPKVPGFAGASMASSGCTSVNKTRLRKNAPNVIHGVSTAGLTGGYVSDSQDRPRTTYSKNARRKMERHGRRTR
jgi:hypothetical protein